MTMALSQEQIAKCRAWATAPSRHWQILNRAKWKYQFRGSAIVRYVEEVKMDEDMVRDMLAYLTSDDCLQDLETYNQGLTPENAYKPTKAWYEIGNKAAGGIRSVRLYHALTADPEENADGPYLVEDECAYKVSLEYHWNETSVPDVQKSTSGVSYRITNISHNQETDRYSYVIETRERVQQDIAKYLTSETAFVKTYKEEHFGVKQSEVPTTGEQACILDGRLVERMVSKNPDCTSDVHNTIRDAKPWIQRYDWASGDSRHYVVKYGNQPDEFANVFVPTDADSVQKNDHINAFNLHDGQIVWSYGPWRTKAGDLKFIKYGKQQKFYRTWVKPHDRRRYHVEHTIQMVFIRGDAYTDYLSDFIEADANRTQVGVLAVKLLDKYNDKDGNLLAEWIRLQGSVGAAKVCTSDCKHGNIDDNAAEAAIARILSAFEGMSAARTSSDNTASALVGLGDAIVASGNFGNTYAFNKEDRWSDGLGFETSNARKK